MSVSYFADDHNPTLLHFKLDQEKIFYLQSQGVAPIVEVRSGDHNPTLLNNVILECASSGEQVGRHWKASNPCRNRRLFFPSWGERGLCHLVGFCSSRKVLQKETSLEIVEPVPVKARDPF